MKRDSANIIKSFIAHKKLIYIVVASFIAIGIVGLFFINKDEFPSFEIKQGLVAGIYPGASAAQVETQLTKPLEEVLFSFSEVDRENTYSYSRDGVCYIFVDLTVPAKKKDEAWSKIKLRLESAQMTLPAGVLAVTVLDDFSAVSSMLVALESSDKGYSELLEYAENLRSRLLEIPEMSNVSILGSQTEEIAVKVDMAKLSSYGISPTSLLMDYQTAGLQDLFPVRLSRHRLAGAAGKDLAHGIVCHGQQSAAAHIIRVINAEIRASVAYGITCGQQDFPIGLVLLIILGNVL